MEDLGSRLPYRVIRVLGEGSHGVVLHVEHKRLGKPFVVKLIQQRFSTNHDVVARFIAEAQRVARLDHEAFVPIVDLGDTDDGRAYFVMEFVAGATLQQALRERGHFAIEEGVGLGLQLLDGLAVAHEAQIIHRDIKPANLFVTAKGRLKILDFGISKSMIDSGSGAQTAHGVAIGTPRYMSPEQAYGRPISAATDLYAAALVLFEMLTGTAVFDGNDAKAILWDQIHKEAPSMRARTGRWFSDELEAVVARALRKDPSERFQSAREMRAALAAALEASRRDAAQSPDATTDERTKPTVRISNGGELDPATRLGDTQGATRAISAEALVVGAASTAQAVLVNPTAPATDPTAQTEAIPLLPPPSRPPPPADSPTAAAVASTESMATPPERRRPLLLVGIFLGTLAIGLSATLAVLHFTRESGPDKQSASGVKARESIPVSHVSVAAPATSIPTTTTSAPLPPSTPAPAVHAAVPKGQPSAASSTSAKPKGHYETAAEAMAAGDLDLADGEARMAVAEGGGTRAQLLLAQILERRGKKAAARDVYAKILESSPQLAAAVAGLKRCGG